jgi:hypothetical protein
MLSPEADVHCQSVALADGDDDPTTDLTLISSDFSVSLRPLPDTFVMASKACPNMLCQFA